MKLSREFIVGVLVVVAIALLYLGINYLKGINLFARQVKFYASYENSAGLIPANAVILNGFKVGIVSDVGLSTTGDGKVLVEVLLNNRKLVVPKDSKLEIYDADLFGVKAIRLILGDSTIMAKGGDTLQGSITLGLTDMIKSEIEPIKQKSTKLFSGIDSILTNLNAMFDDPSAKNIPDIFSSLQYTINNLESTTENLDVLINNNSQKLTDIFSNVESITGNLKNNNETLSRAIQNIGSISDTLAKVQLASTIKKVDAAMTGFSEVMNGINEGRGTLGQLAVNDSLHTELVNASKSLDLLLNDMRIHPKRYLSFSMFGKKDSEDFSKKELEQMRREIDRMIEEKGVVKQ
ncbi:MAG: MCE family protein [Crocinitomicaceae bacterium]|nr:MCE family protein [Crocinitomicaceae bacterium]